MLPVAILAGGLATRLGPLTERVPKALLEVAGRPFIWHQLELLRRQGVDRVVLCLGHLGQQIEAAIGDGRRLGLSVGYSFDGAVRLGTGGAVKRALPLLGDAFFVLNGDSYLPCPLQQIQAAYEASRSPALMAVIRNDNRWDTSNVNFENGVLTAYDKHFPRPDMSYIDYGVCVLSARVFENYPALTAIDLAVICRDLAASRCLEAFEVTERFYEIGSVRGIADTEAFLRRASRPA